MANSGSAPNCAYGGNANAPSWSEPASGPFIYSSNGIDTGPPGFGGSAVTIAMITDGTSNTAGFSERVKAIGNNLPATPRRSMAAFRRRRSPAPLRSRTI